jgi:fucose 4-O-acetylase-like acetyltransferase
VVVGHSWTLLPAVSTSSPVYVFLYSFHVPAFVLVTGYLSRSFTWSRPHLLALLRTVVVPYVVFETLLAGFRVLVGHERFGPLYLSPHWPLWYLTVLFCWRLATPVLRRVPHPMVLAVVVCLVGGLRTIDTLDLARATGLLPFFVAGLLVTREQLAWLARPRVRAVAAGLLGAAFVAATLVAGHVSKEWLYWRTGYPDLGVPDWLGALVRLGLLPVSGVLALSLLALVPRSQRWFTALGSASLVVYLVHPFAVKAAEYAGIDRLSSWDPVTAFVLVTAGAVALSLLLAAGPVARMLDVLVDPISTLTSDGPAPDLHPHRRAGAEPLPHRDLIRHG